MFGTIILAIGSYPKSTSSNHNYYICVMIKLLKSAIKYIILFIFIIFVFFYHLIYTLSLIRAIISTSFGLHMTHVH